MSFSLQPQLEEKVKNIISSGPYQSPNEVMSEALHLLEERDRMEKLKLEALRRDIDIGINEIEQGKECVVDIEDIILRGHEKLKTKRQDF